MTGTDLDQPIDASATRPVCSQRTTGGSDPDGEPTGGAELACAYRRLLRWYPPEWRARNEIAVVGILLDQADATGRSAPTVADRVALTCGGVGQTFRVRERPSLVSFTAVSGGTILSLIYLAATWTPGTGFPHQVWPFTNPSVIAGALMIAAFVCMLLHRVQGARLLILCGILVELAMGILCHIFLWPGPTWPTVTLYTCCGILAAGPFRRTRTDITAILLLGGLVAYSTLAPTGFDLLAGEGPWLLIADLAVIAPLAIGVFLLTGRLRQQAAWRRADEGKDQHGTAIPH